MLSAIVHRDRTGSAKERSSRVGPLIHVRDGYRPDVVHARAYEPVRLTFVREESASCSERVVFPAFGKSTMLPRWTPVVVDLPPSPPGTYEFTCAMSILRGRLVVDDERP